MFSFYSRAEQCRVFWWRDTCKAFEILAPTQTQSSLRDSAQSVNPVSAELHTCVRTWAASRSVTGLYAAEPLNFLLQNSKCESRNILRGLHFQPQTVDKIWMWPRWHRLLVLYSSVTGLVSVVLWGQSKSLNCIHRLYGSITDTEPGWLVLSYIQINITPQTGAQTFWILIQLSTQQACYWSNLLQSVVFVPVSVFQC